MPEVVTCLKFLTKHSDINIHSFIEYVIERAGENKLDPNSNKQGLAHLDMLFVIQRFYHQNNIDNPFKHKCEKMAEELKLFIKTANTEFLLTIDQALLFAPFSFVEAIQ